MNTSTVDLEETARTQIDCAHLRARFLAKQGVKSVLELCVGPSLKTLEKAYDLNGIKVWGNDIDHRWQKYHPSGVWIMGDALKVSYSGVDCVVFAPPLSMGCTGKREDALSPLKVVPSYFAFLERFAQDNIKKCIMTLPGRSFSTTYDRTETYHVINRAACYGITKGNRIEKDGVLKYYDLFVEKVLAP